MKSTSVCTYLVAFAASLFVGCATTSTHLYPGKSRPITELATIKTYRDLEIDGQRRKDWPPDIYVLPGQHTLGIYGFKLSFAAVAGHRYERKAVSYASDSSGQPLKVKTSRPESAITRAQLGLAAASFGYTTPESYTFIVDRTTQKVVSPVPHRARVD